MRRLSRPARRSRMRYTLLAALLAIAVLAAQAAPNPAAAQRPIEPPCIVVIGEVVRLRDGLDWQGAAEGRVLDDDPLKLRARRETG